MDNLCINRSPLLVGVQRGCYLDFVSDRPHLLLFVTPAIASPHCPNRSLHVLLKL
ncbi:hypothetical protein L3556_12280 [Candidatus Synechococcus calcipolaris G9]|uniref:Uncharacterized protein n=1 Tax=Candidatus Synechococcus calcipolaris G9 TaxID=1497997 RepID=A0ABT6F1J8_9SYNE|nr:hypothetical protein [Candidatus Synechococcus calcipolaris]MDG2991702.1 hypothetical protein [Candidatus Synechococcus calcipolaris G9]